MIAKVNLCQRFDMGGMVFSPGFCLKPLGSRLVAGMHKCKCGEIVAGPSELQESRFDISWLMKSPSLLPFRPSL